MNLGEDFDIYDGCGSFIFRYWSDFQIFTVIIYFYVDDICVIGFDQDFQVEFRMFLDRYDFSDNLDTILIDLQGPN